MLRVSYSILASVLPFSRQEDNRCFKTIIENTPENQKILEDMTQAALRGDFYDHVDAWEI